MRDLNEITDKIIGAAIEVHRTLGPGLLESTYETCLAHELVLREVQFERQKPIPVVYKRAQLDCGFRVDLLVEDKVIVELKAVKRLAPVHKAQLITYLKLTDLKLGLLLNFNVRLMKQGVKRVALNL